MKLQIGIIGSGKLGSTLAHSFALAGHQVLCGSREPLRAEASGRFSPSIPNLLVVNVEQAIYKSSVILFAIPGDAMDEMLRKYSADLHGKTVIDATNSTTGSHPIQRIIASSHVIRSFHYQSAEVYEQSRFGDLHPDLFYCGSAHPIAESHMQALAACVEMRPVRVGGWEEVGLIDALEKLWKSISTGRRTRRMGFMLVQ